MAKMEMDNQSNDICRISKGTTITGIITSTSDIRIDGVFEGTIYTKGKLVVGESSKIKGSVLCGSCDLWGSVEGEIYVEELINLKNKSVLTGSLKTPKLGIEVGAIFNGNCNIITKDQFNKYLNEIVPLPAQSRPSAPMAKESKEN